MSGARRVAEAAPEEWTSPRVRAEKRRSCVPWNRATSKGRRLSGVTGINSSPAASCSTRQILFSAWSVWSVGFFFCVVRGLWFGSADAARRTPLR